MAQPEEISSKLAIEAAIRSHVLSTVANNFANSEFALLEFFSKTLFAFQRDLHELEEVLEKVVDFLEGEEMIKRSENKDFLVGTPLGKRVAQLYIDPLSAVVLRDSLIAAEKKSTKELSYLHAIARTGEMGNLYLRKGDAETFSMVLFDNIKSLLSEVPESMSPWDHESLVSEVKMASFLFDWINEASEEAIREKYNLAAGDVRTKVEVARWMLYSMREIGRLLGFSKQREIRNLETRVRHGIKEELLELVSLKGIGRVRARMLYRHGFKNQGDIRKVDLKTLANVETIGEVIAASIKEQVLT